MLILVDENIPLAEKAFGGIGEVRTVSGQDLRPEQLGAAEILLVRSVTRVNADLLRGSRIRFVASATIGTDHVDLRYLQDAGIAFAHAPGSNADSVADYVVAAVLRLAIRRSRPLRGMRAGIVGCGEIGGRLSSRFAALGMQVLQNDPPLAERMERDGRPHGFLPQEVLLSDADLVTVHVPLESAGPHPTVHLIDHGAICEMKEDAWLINTSRGPVVDNGALKRLLRERSRPRAVVLDVWEKEPTPDAELVQRADLASAHIAGYAADAKLRGTWMLHRSLRQFLELDDPGPDMPPEWAGLRRDIRLTPPDPRLTAEEWLDLLVRQMYDIGRDDAALREIAAGREVDARRFAALRRDYPVRREFSAFALPRSTVPADLRTAVADGLGVRLV